MKQAKHKVSMYPLYRLMDAKNLSAAELARRMKSPESTVGYWLSGKTTMPLWAALKISELFGQSVNSLFSLE